MLFFFIESLYLGRRGETLADFVYYFMDGLLKTLAHIRIRLIKSSFKLLLYKAL